MRALVQLWCGVLVCVSVATPVSAEDRSWFSGLDREAREGLERGLGFARKFREPGQCKETVDELAGAATSLSPEVLGAVVGLALGAAAGAASTTSFFGALRGGILLGSVGSALGHLADVLMPDQVAALADDVQDLIQARDGKLCELIKASDKLRAPVLQHLETSLAETCAGDALPRCMRDNPRAAQIFDRHASVLNVINQGTCRVAASVARRFERSIAHKPDAPAEPTLSPFCDEQSEAARPLGDNIL